MESENINNQKVENEQKVKRNRFGWKFFAVFLFTALIAAGLLVLWAWICYNMRFSVSVIRAGLTSLYILPCLLGGRLLRLTRQPGLPLWGGALGIAVFGLLCLCTFFSQGGQFDFEELSVTIPLMCVLSGAAGTIRIRKQKAQTGNQH